MLDLIGAVGGLTIFAIIAGVFIGLSPAQRSAKVAAVVAAAAWVGVVVALALRGAFAPGALGPIPAPAAAFAALAATLFAMWVASRRFRAALLGVPMSALIAINAGRLGSVVFFVLTAQRRLSAPFGPIAGLGDILVGALAIPLAAIVAARGARIQWIAIWNTLGAIDLFIAIVLGALSAPGSPVRVFTEGAGTTAMTEFPWVLVPAVLVPLYLLAHFTIAKKLQRHRRKALAIQYAA